MFTALVIAAAMLALLIASIYDLKTGEIPEKISMGLIAFLLLASAAHTAYAGDPTHLLQPVILGLISLALGYALFLLGQWGGGDVKILAGVGCLFGYLTSLGYVWPNNTLLGHPLPVLLTYFINMAVISTPYVIIYTLVLGIMHPRAFREYAVNLRQKKVLSVLTLSLLPLAIALYFGFSTLSLIYLLVPLMVLASVYMKTVEETVLKKTVKVSELREWDIMADDVVVGGVKIASKRDIEGITPEQLNKIRELADEGRIPDTLKIKWGVKFVPILFLSLYLTLYLGNILELLFMILFEVH